MRWLNIICTTAFLAVIFLPQNLSAKVGYCSSTKEMMLGVRAEKMRLIFRGISVNGHLVTVYLNQSGKFLAVVHQHNQKSCIADEGYSGDGVELKKYERS